jgi:hypothetical protein
VAEAEAEAIRIQRKALRSSPKIIELRKIESANNRIEKWDGRQSNVTTAAIDSEEIDAIHRPEIKCL